MLKEKNEISMVEKGEKSVSNLLISSLFVVIAFAFGLVGGFILCRTNITNDQIDCSSDNDVTANQVDDSNLNDIPADQINDTVSMDIVELDSLWKIADGCELIKGEKSPSGNIMYEIVCKTPTSYGRGIVGVDLLITGGGFGLFEMQRGQGIEFNTDLDFIDFSDEYTILSETLYTNHAYAEAPYEPEVFSKLFETSDEEITAEKVEFLEVYFVQEDTEQLNPIIDLSGHEVILAFEIVSIQGGDGDITDHAPMASMFSKMISIFEENLIEVEI